MFCPIFDPFFGTENRRWGVLRSSGPVVRLASVVVVVGLVAAVEERESGLFTEEELEEVGRAVRRDRVGLNGRVVFEARL